jgi:anti-sigma B factor antagonist
LRCLEVEKVMEVAKRQIGNVALIDISGRIVAGESLLLRDSVRELIAFHETNIVLNLQQVPYIDSAGIGELVSALVAVRRYGGSLKLLNLSRRVREVLEIVKLLSVFPVFDSEAEALATFTSPRGYAQPMVARAG